MTKIKLNAFHLKLIAIIAMVIDHSGTIFNHNNQSIEFLTESIGFLTFPIMAYLISEGWHYTKNKRLYILRMGLFWLISTLPYHYAFQQDQHIINPFNNIFFTLFIGLLLLSKLDKNKPIDQLKYYIVFSLLTLFSDWGGIGVIAIGQFAICRKHKHIKLFNKLIPSTYIPIIYLFCFNLINELVRNPIKPHLLLSTLTLLAIPYLLSLYNGTRGPNSKFIKWGFYWFYPIHLSLLIIIHNLIK